MVKESPHKVVLKRLKEILQVINDAPVLEDDLKGASDAGQAEALLSVLHKMTIPENAKNNACVQLREIQEFCEKRHRQKPLFSNIARFIDTIILDM